MRSRAMSALVVASIAFAWPAVAANITTGLDVAGSQQTEIYKINDDGDMAGTFVDSAGRHGFLRTGGVDLTLDVAGAAWTMATGLTNRDANGRLTVVGQHWSGNKLQGFFAEYDPSGGADPFTYTLTPAAVRVHTMPWDINDRQVIVGCTHSAGEADMLPWLLVGGSILTAADQSSMYTGINGGGEITGFWYEPSLIEGRSFILKGQTTEWFRAFANARHTRSYDINDSGDTVGFFFGQPGNPGMHGFVRLANGTTTSFDVPGAVMTHAYGINNRGVIVGAYRDSSGAWHGFRRDP